ncbi:MAG: 2-isopropylmalate synthase [Acidobacteriia bacterium]|nr:2-isopropylmalate synthase [Terriglobia bacterium]
METMEVMDTTLRDGEQTPGVNFTPDEKLIIAEALLRSGVDAIEIASARISDGEAQAVQRITEWARSHGLVDRIEILGFVDGTRSVDWIVQNGGRVLNLLAKGSEHHCRVQLKKSPDEHFQDIARTVCYADQCGLSVNVYPEDWSQGMRDSQEYVMALAGCLCELPVKRIMLADTLGVLAPEEAEAYVRLMTSRFTIPFDFHGHDDYGLAVSNSLAALRAGAGRVHVTMNGLGERAGNTNLTTLVVAARDLYGITCKVDERALGMLSDLVAGISGVEPAANAPVIGRLSAIQGCGVHADGDKKGNLYQNKLDPARFGLTRSYDLGKTAGLASIEQNCQELGIEISPEQQRALLAKVKELGDQKVAVTQADIILLLNDILSAKGNVLKLVDYEFAVRKGTSPAATLQLRRNEEQFVAHGVGDGQYDAFINALRSVWPEMPELVDYRIGISRKGTSEALTEATITWRSEGKLFSTRAVDSDQLVAAMNATMRMLNYVELKRELGKH